MTHGVGAEQADLIAQLCLKAGRIMEDQSPNLALVLPETTEGIALRIAAVRRAGEDIAALAAAAEVIARRAIP